MTEQMMIRWALVLQNQAPSTLDKYICKLAEAVLLGYDKGLSVVELSQAINEQFNLSFTLDEIQSALNRKSEQHVVIVEDKYVLSPKTRETLIEEDTLENDLNQFIESFLIENPSVLSAADISSLLVRYLYYCFNSNVNNLLSLFSTSPTKRKDCIFEATDTEITTINAFMSWKNPQKDSFIYNIIATCCEYCMLTIKKDNALSRELFRGKKFYLDANIIFRIAGINNDERQFVIQDFIHHCHEVGIDLCCTTETLDEVYRVVSAQIDYIRGITSSSMPVSCEVLSQLNPNYEINDFYRLYYNWCTKDGNRFDDYLSFQQYLLSIVQEAIKLLSIKQSTAYKVGKSAEQFKSRVDSLIEYKNSKRRHKYITYTSAETDIANICDVIMWRKKADGTIWQTNDFIVSADQLLIGWAADNFPGLPIVVLPSVWLSIILRFSGRTDDDYKSFCLFLTQRHHWEPKDVIDPTLLLNDINSKTDSRDLKEKIIIEIAQNKSSYTFNSTKDYDQNVNLAFEKVLEEFYGKAKQDMADMQAKMNAQFERLATSADQIAEERAKLSAEAEREKMIVLLSKKQAHDKVKTFRSIGQKDWIFYIIGGLVIISGLAIWIFEPQPLFDQIRNALPQKLNGDSFMNVWTIATCGVGLVTIALGKLIHMLGGKDREERLFQKYAKANREL